MGRFLSRQIGSENPSESRDHHTFDIHHSAQAGSRCAAERVAGETERSVLGFGYCPVMAPRPPITRASLIRDRGENMLRARRRKKRLKGGEWSQSDRGAGPLYKVASFPCADQCLDEECLGDVTRRLYGPLQCSSPSHPLKVVSVRCNSLKHACGNRHPASRPAAPPLMTVYQNQLRESRLEIRGPPDLRAPACFRDLGCRRSHLNIRRSYLHLKNMAQNKVILASPNFCDMYLISLLSG